jgi:hypothetical protein
MRRKNAPNALGDCCRFFAASRNVCAARFAACARRRRFHRAPDFFGLGAKSIQLLRCFSQCSLSTRAYILRHQMQAAFRESTLKYRNTIARVLMCSDLIEANLRASRRSASLSGSHNV